MKLLKNLTIGLSLATSLTMVAQSDLTPDIIFPQPGSSVVIVGMSDNGQWAVASPRQEAEGSGDSLYAGAVLYNISGKTATSQRIGENVIGTSAMDVSDDGKTVVGSYKDFPAYWTSEKGWKTLPVVGGVTCKGGTVNSVTPDGRYAVGFVKYDADGMYADGCMWDLTTEEIIKLPNMPKVDLSGENQRQNWLTQLSADGRYLFGTISFSYPADTNLYVYDRENDEVIYIGHTKEGENFVPRIPGLASWETDVTGKALSSSGQYVSGTVEDLSQGDRVAFIFDVFNRELKITDAKNEVNSWAWNVTNTGMGLCTKPALDLYGTAYFYYDNFYYSVEDLLKGVYGINLGRYNITNTGKPTLVSADGRTMLFVTSQWDSHFIRFKEDVEGALSRIDLLASWTSDPVNNSTMSAINSVKVAFTQPIQTSETNYSKVQLLDSKGNLVANPLANGGLTADNNVLNIMFRTRMLAEGETYTLKIPAGIVWVDGKQDAKNSDIEIKFKGRGDNAVKITGVTPEDGAAISTLDLTENPIVLSFDATVKLNENAQQPFGYLYIDEEENPISQLVISSYTPTQLAVYPPYLQHLYKGSKYRVEIPAGVAVDISGHGESAAFSVTYEGTYVPQLGDEKYLFKSACDNFDNFLFYEGDYGNPTSLYAGMGFTADTTPWWVVRDDEESVDMAFASHSSYTDGRQSDDWFVIRQLAMPEEDAYLAFDSQSYRKNKQDKLKVYVFEYDGVLNALNKDMIEKIKTEADLVYDEIQSPGATEEKMAGEWTHNTIPLTKYANKNIYICFQNDNQNQSMVMVDNIEVVRDLKAVITLSTPTNVVNEPNVVIKGRMNVASEVDSYKGLTLTLKDADGKTISTISEPNLTLSYGDIYNFEFDKPLPLQVGEENGYVIEYTLGDISAKHEGVIRDLTFQPTKRVVIEEFTGRDCGYCPQGIIVMDRLEKLYGEQVIPIALHCYEGSDPKGMNVMNYWQFTGMNAAPSAMVNRRGITAPLYFSSTLNKYVASTSELPEGESALLWQDEVADELNESAYMDVSLTPTGSSGNNLKFTATVKSAINLKNQNIRVFGVLLEDGLVDYQRNYLSDSKDPIIGEWGSGGQYGKSVAAPVTFNNVARSTWGRSYNGTSGLIPNDISSSEEYTVDINVPLPQGFVENVNNLKFVVILIDENTGRVINACVEKAVAPSGVEGIEAENGNAPKVSATFDGIQVESASRAMVEVYSTAGMTLARTEGEGTFTVDLNGYKGVAIVKAVNAEGGVSVKLMIK